MTDRVVAERKAEILRLREVSHVVVGRVPGASEGGRLRVEAEVVEDGHEPAARRRGTSKRSRRPWPDEDAAS
jgi:hypothetical protein